MSGQNIMSGSMSVVNIGFTGTRAGCTYSQKLTLQEVLEELRTKYYAEWMHNGDAIGCDYEAAEIWHSLDGKIFLRPCDHKDRGFFPHYDKIAPKRKPLDRNKDIVSASSFVVACSATMKETQRGGTWSTVRYAESRGRKVIIVFPDGSIEKRNFREQDAFSDFEV